MAQLNFQEESLDKKTGLYDLYERLLNGMRNANKEEAPGYIANPPLNTEGEIDQEALTKLIQNDTDIRMKNSAYMMANSVMATVSGGGTGGTSGVGFVSRSGDTMTGKLSALFGFDAGLDGESFIVLDADKGVVFSKDVNLSSLLFSSSSSIKYDDETATLNIAGDKIKLTGDITIDGGLTLGDVVINDDGISLNGDSFFSSANANLSTVDWAMKDANISGNASVDGDLTVKGGASLLYGFQLGYNGVAKLYDTKDNLTLDSQLNIKGGSDFIYGDKSFLSLTTDVDKGIDIAKFSMPDGEVILGDNSSKILIEAGIYGDADYEILSPRGDADFQGSFKARASNTSDYVISTYANGSDYGVVIPQKLRFKQALGAFLTGDESSMTMGIPYSHGDTVSNIGITIKQIETTSPFKKPSEWSATSLIDSDAEFFQFAKPIETEFISIKSDKYKTKLAENELLFSDKTSIIGTEDGLFHKGNAYFDKSLSSQSFSSGFAGSGWQIGEDKTYGGTTATFDNLVIRKKFRVYEMEVDSISATNGSLWVSSSIEANLVEEIE